MILRKTCIQLRFAEDTLLDFAWASVHKFKLTLLVLLTGVLRTLLL
jgi:hypothetical protein